jgi:2-iminobutanoate/2-iminopropanoate deaminase
MTAQTERLGDAVSWELQHYISPWDVPEAYSGAVRCGPFIFTSGQLGTETGGTPVPFETQAHNALSRLIATGELAGGNSSTLLKVNAYLASIDDFPVFDRVYRTLIGAAPMPARKTIAAGSLVSPALIEVEAIALIAH